MKIQSPKGTRDFYPADLAWHRYVLDAWRRVSVRNGFEQVDGPIFEKLDLYKVKSGEGIVSELFSFRRANGSTDFAIRPEFTPTLARMVAARANALPRPIKWFCTPNFCRAERPQRGRLREFWQWNIDLLGLDDVVADAEVIFTAVDLLAELGLRSDLVKVKISHRETVRQILLKMGVPSDRMLDAFDLLDRRDKMSAEAFAEGAAKLGLSADKVQRFEETCRMKYPAGRLASLAKLLGSDEALADLQALDEQLHGFGIAEWCEYDLGIVRGLAYYTDTVFEIHEVSGAERAIAGGGRYDKLVELFGGPSMPAVGFGMGDVVLSNVLIDKGLVPEDVMPRPDVYLVAATDRGATFTPGFAAKLRRAGLHARFSYRTTRNVGKLMKEVSSSGARYALIADDSAAEGTVELKDMASGEQAAVSIEDVATRVIAPA